MDKIATTNLDMDSRNILNVNNIHAVVTSTSILTANTIQGTNISASAGVSGASLQTTSGNLTISQTGIIKPEQTDVCDIGTALLKFKDSYQSGTATVGSVILPGGDVQTQIDTLNTACGELDAKTQNITAITGHTYVAGLFR